MCLFVCMCFNFIQNKKKKTEKMYTNLINIFRFFANCIITNGLSVWQGKYTHYEIRIDDLKLNKDSARNENNKTSAQITTTAATVV